MCGITGKWNFNSTQTVSAESIRKMADLLHHRGPDDTGIWTDKSIGLGHKRLSIIDLSYAGHQPMSNQDGSLWIVFNGEIYNFPELRIFLQKKGYRFKSHTDTETILYLYELYREKCLGYLRGMFAFAIWDKTKQLLFLARDRIGKKPLKYYMDDQCFIFASELKAILADPHVPKQVDDRAVYNYLTFAYVPQPATGFKNIKKLPQASYAVLQKGQLRIEKYWQVNYSNKIQLKQNEYEEKLLDKLAEAVKLRLISDVPLGAFLSGGIDSSVIVALMSRLSTEKVKTFSIGFKEESHNELPFARLMAEKYRTEHHEFVVNYDLVRILPELVYHYEEPFADPSALPTYYLCKMTRQHVTVALNGDGGDENFAGYERYQQFCLINVFYNLPNVLQQSLLTIAQKILAFQTESDLARRLGLIRQISNLEKYDQYREIMSSFDTELRHNLLTADFLDLNGINNLSDENTSFSSYFNNDLVDSLLNADVNTYLVDDLMVKVDIMSMCHSLECRSPFLDHELVELIASYPAHCKLRNFNKKYILKKAIKNLVPDEIIHRKKAGFGIPIKNWFKHDLKEYIYDSLLNSKIVSESIVKSAEVKKLLDRQMNSQADYSNKIWTLLMLEEWLKKWF